MDTRDKQMGTSETPKSQQGNGESNRKDERFKQLWEHLHCELGELSLAVGQLTDSIRQFDYRRVESLQGSIDETFQSTEETLKELQATYYSDRHTDPTGHS